MRGFDVVGVLAVVGWVGIVGAFVHDTYIAPQTSVVEAGAVFREGESYMLLTREDRDVGFIHESRTKVDETNGWLLEYDLMMNVSMLGIDQYLETEIKATVDASAVLEDFSAAISTAGAKFDISGEVEGTVVTMKMQIAGQDREQKITLKQPPRLSNSALNQLVANPDLQPGTKFEQEYFDPTIMGMTTMTFEYVRQHTVDVFGEKVPTYHFRQLVAGTELDAYVDKNGEVFIQEFPLRIVGARLPESLGRARAQSIRRKFEKDQETKKDGAEGQNLSIEATMDLLRGGDLAAAIPTTKYRVHIPDGVTFQLESAEQKVMKRKEHVAEIDTAGRGTAPDEGLNPDIYLGSDLRVDADNKAFEELLPENAPTDSNLIRAEMLARAVQKRLTEAPEIGVQTASAALANGKGDCTEYALVLVAALRHHKIPARFVSGVKADPEGRFILHQWVQYWDGDRFVDIDPTTPTMLPDTAQIQLFTHIAPDKPEMATIIAELQIEKIIDDSAAAPNPVGVESDFN